MLYILAFAMALLSVALQEGNNSDLATIGGFIFLGLAIQTSELKRKK